jgi:hypothetical protein
MVSRSIAPTGSVRPPLYTRPHIIQSVSNHKPASRKADSPLDPKMLGLGRSLPLDCPAHIYTATKHIDGSYLSPRLDWVIFWRRRYHRKFKQARLRLAVSRLMFRWRQTTRPD